MGTTLLERATGLGDTVTAHIEDMERERRLAEPVVTAIRDTGLHRSLIPAALGGDERHLVEVLEATERIATFDGSTGWCAAIGSGSNLFAGYFAQELAATVWSDPDQGNAGMFGPFGQVRRDGDGLALSGRWPFCSNSLHSSWIGLGTRWYGDGDEPEAIPRYVMVPIDDVTVESTWDATGLCGTGSHHAAVDGVHVTREGSITFLDRPWADGPLWRLPLFCILAPALGIVPLGIARGALDEVAQRIEDKTTSVRGPLAEDPVSLADFAEADAALRAARAGLFDAVNRAWDRATRGEPVPKTIQAQVMMSMGYGCQVAFDVTAAAHRLGGGSAAYADSSLLRRLRDVQTARQHVMFGRVGRPMMAKTLAGEDTFAPPFIV